MKTEVMKIAGFRFSFRMPEEREVDSFLPWFREFRCTEEGTEEYLFRMECVDTPLMPAGTVRVLEEATNDMGLTRILELEEGYRVEVRPAPGCKVQVVHADAGFSRIQAVVDWNDPYAGRAFSALLRIVFSQAVILQGGVSVHASAVVKDEKVWLFMGKSGTGKSTHASLWLQCFPQSELLNDDNPILRIEGEEVKAYGSPWSGKTACYKNKGYRVGGIVRLRQAAANRFIRKEEVEAFVGMLPGCSAIREDERLYGCLCDTLVWIAEHVVVGVMECRPDREAARICADALEQVEREKYNNE